MTFRRGSQLGRRPKRRETDWVGSGDAAGYTTVAAGVLLLDQSLTSVDTPETIVRVRGVFDVQSDQAATDERPFGAFGFGIVSQKAFALGATAISGPYSEAAWDGWFVHQYWFAPFSFRSAVGASYPNQRYEFDSKAMRKLTPDQKLVVMVENRSTVGMRFNLGFRMLIKAT